MDCGRWVFVDLALILYPKCRKNPSTIIGPINDQTISMLFFHVSMTASPLCYQRLWLVNLVFDRSSWSSPEWSSDFSLAKISLVNGKSQSETMSCSEAIGQKRCLKESQKRYHKPEISQKHKIPVFFFFLITEYQIPTFSPKIQPEIFQKSESTVVTGSRCLDQGATDSRGVGGMVLFQIGGVVLYR